ncbi:MAG: hypothetical protein KKB51_17395 [Candidatus Riflebacteria bacterium]|nr:hypothetical protein [Candidatus Riflebacteria bacterium]
MQNFEITTETTSDYLLIRQSGYFNAEAAVEFSSIISGALESGKCNFIVNLENCSSVNSPAVAHILDLCLQIVEDHHGAIVIFGLNNLKKSFFEMAGIFPLASSTNSFEEAVLIINQLA